MHPHARTVLPLLVIVSLPLALLAPVGRATAQATGGKNRELFARIARATKEGKTTETDMVGTGDQPFTHTWKYGGYLAGLEISYGTFAGSKLILRSVRPIYQTPDGLKAGTTYGSPSAALKRIVAKPGYAIGALHLFSGLCVDGVEITFMALEGDRLNLDKTYKSEWYGSKGQGKGKKLGGDGSLVVGIFGKTAGLRVDKYELRGLGLILLDEK